VGKTLQKDSIYNQFDEDGDGIVTDEEMAKAERMLQIENDDKKQDAQRGMAWFALAGMLLYPFAIIIASIIGQETASGLLKDIALLVGSMAIAFVAGFITAKQLNKKAIED
jgi:flagellar motor component MotA